MAKKNKNAFDDILVNIALVDGRIARHQARLRRRMREALRDMRQAKTDREHRDALERFQNANEVLGQYRWGGV